MSTLLQPALAWSPCGVADVDAMLDIEQAVYSHPWSRGNFTDSLSAAYWAWTGRNEQGLCAYWLAMPVLDEVHLLNLAVHPDHWGRGLATQAVAHLLAQAAAQRMREVWLEVRQSNVRAQALYQRCGFSAIGRRRAYYPADAGQREDAILMRLTLAEAP